MVAWLMKQRLQPIADYNQPDAEKNVERLRQIQGKIETWARSRQIPIPTDQRSAASIEQKSNVVGHANQFGMSYSQSVRADAKPISNPVPVRFVSINPINMAAQDEHMGDQDKCQTWHTQIQALDVRQQPPQPIPSNPEIGYQIPGYPPPYSYPYYPPGYEYYVLNNWSGVPMQGSLIQNAKSEGSEDYRTFQKGESTYQSSIDIMNFRHMAKK